MESDKPTLAQIGNVYVPVDGDSIVIRIDYTLQWDGSINGPVGGSATVSVNGQQFVAEDYEETDQPFPFGVDALFLSFQSGLHTVQETRVGFDGTTEEVTWSYHQRALTLEEEVPELDMESAEPIEIQNKVIWDDLASLSSEVAWSIAISGAEVQEHEKEGTGVDIYALWKPLDDLLERYVNPDFIPPTERLVPVGATISAETPVYEDYREEEYPERGPIIYKITKGFQVPGRTKVKIIESTVNPLRPFENGVDFATITAEVIFFDEEIQESDVKWTVRLEDMEGNAALEEPLSMGEGCEISATWDGLINGETPPNDPRTYQFVLEADACGDGGPDVGVLRAIRGQVAPEEGEECVPEKVARPVYTPVGFLFEITDLEFGGSQDLESRTVQRSENGPYLVYDYINDEAPNDQSQWVKEGDAMVPVVMKQGTDAYMKVNFQLLQAQSPFGEQAGVIQDIEEIRATLTYDDGSVYILAMQDVNIDPIPFIGLSGDAMLRVPMREGIGRHQVTIKWEFDLINSEKETIIVETSTPEEGGHMVYTVLGEQPTDTTNFGETDRESYIWYHGERFRDQTVVSEPVYLKNELPTRSPLDLATTWASGAEGYEIDRLAKNFFDHSGYRYYGQTNRSDVFLGQMVFGYYKILGERNLECADAANLLKIYANYLGLEARIRRWEDDVSINTPAWARDFLFTNYITMIGQEPDDPFSTDFVQYILPLSIVGDKQKQFDGAGSGNGKIVGTSDFVPLDWLQYRFFFHQVVDLNGAVIDCSARFDNRFRTAEENPEFIINALNVQNVQTLAKTISGIVHDYTLSEEAKNAMQPSYTLFFSPVEDEQSLLTETEYLEKFLYGSVDILSVREETGFNNVDFRSKATVYDKLEFTR